MLILEILIAAMFLVSNVTWTILYLRQGNQLAEMAKLLASRTFSEYSVGEARLAEARSGRKPDEGYEAVWKRG